MTHQRQTGTGRQPPALSRARQSRKKLPAALTVPRLAALAASLPLLLAIAGAASPAASAGVTAAQAASKDDFFFAGYRVSGPATSASARFTVPTLACPPRGNLAVYPGVDLTSEAGAIIEAGLRLRCRNGAPAYVAVIIANNTLDRVPVTVSPGDQVAVRVTQTATAGTASITDLTRGSSATVPTNTGAKNLIADVGVEAVIDGPAPLRKVPPFGTMTFSAAEVNGAALGASNPTAINRTFFGTLQILTGPLDSTGTSFTTTFKHR
jgi:hypothetical protein